MEKEKNIPEDETLRELSFEEAIEQLNGIVEALEGGELPLDGSLDAFERGVKLVKLCESRLDAAENRVKLLIEEGDGYGEMPFPGAD